MAEVASAYVSLIPSAKGFGRTLNGQIGPQVDRVGRDSGKRLGDGMAKGIGGSTKKIFAPIAAGIAAVGIGGFFKDAISGASDLNEAGTKVEAIFGKVGKTYVDAFSKKGAKALGQTQLDVLNAASTFGTFGKAAGLSGKELAGFSTGLAGLSTDFSSFFNTSPETAVEAIGAALRGEAEPIRQFGILLDDATLKAEAMRLGLLKPTKDANKIMAAQARVTIAQKNYNDVVKKSGKDSLAAIKAQANLGTAQGALQKATDGTIGPLTQQQKILAAQSSIYKQSKDAQGDFQKTSGGLANQQRILSAQFSDLRTKIGQQLLPVAVKFATFLNDKFIPGVLKLGSKFGDMKDAFTFGSEWESKSPLEKIAVGARKVVDTIRGAVPLVKAFFGGLLKGDTGYAGPLEKFAVAGAKVRDVLATARDKVVAFGGWLKNDLWPALQEGYKTILPGIQEAFRILTGGGKGSVDGAGKAFKSVGTVITDVVIPAVANFVRNQLPVLALQIRGVIEAVKALYTGFVKFKDVVADVAIFVLQKFASIAEGFGRVLVALGKVPGFGWAKAAGEKLLDAAGGARKLADGIAAIKSKDVTIGVNFKVNGSGQVTLANGVKVDVGQFKARALGGPVRAGEPYIVGERRPELFVPNRNGKIIPKVPVDSQAAGEGGMNVRVGTVVAHDYDDFTRQLEKRQRHANALGY